MKWRTHIFVAVALMSFLSEELFVLSVTAFFAIFPDIISILKNAEEKRFGWTHSIFFTIGTGLSIFILSSALGQPLSLELGVAAIIGMGSHQILDAMTFMGVALFWPYNEKIIKLPPGKRYDKFLPNFVLSFASALLIYNNIFGFSLLLAPNNSFMLFYQAIIILIIIGISVPTQNKHNRFRQFRRYEF